MIHGFLLDPVVAPNATSSSGELYPTELAATLQCRQGAIRAARYNVDGNYCVTCGSDKSVKLWAPAKKMLLSTYMGHGFEVLDACCSSDNALLASGSMDKTVCEWDVETGKVRRKFRNHAGAVNAVAYNEDSSVVFSACLDGCVRAWDTRARSTTTPIQTMDEASDSVLSLVVSAHEIVTGAADNRVRRYDLRAGKMHEDFVGAAASCVTMTRDGQALLVSTTDAHVRLLDKDNGELLAQFTGHKNATYKLESCTLSTEQHVLSGSEDGRVVIWDLISGSIVASLRHPSTLVVHCLSPHPTKPSLLTASGSYAYVWTVPEVDEPPS